MVIYTPRDTLPVDVRRYYIVICVERRKSSRQLPFHIGSVIIPVGSDNNAEGSLGLATFNSRREKRDGKGGMVDRELERIGRDENVDSARVISGLS